VKILKSEQDNLFNRIPGQYHNTFYIKLINIKLEHISRGHLMPFSASESRNGVLEGR
jgi:hypothetical protein